MEWSDDAIVLTARRHGESAAVVSLLTRERGRHVGLVRGGFGQRARGLYEPGNRVRAVWRARLAEHLGHYACELLDSHAAALLDEPPRLAALAAAAAVAEAALPEREPHGRVYDRLRDLLAALCAPAPDAAWQAAYVRWEIDLLADLGFGLDLAGPAATGGTDALAFVSPKTGRAVSLAAGEPYRDRLLPLPAFLLDERAVADPAQIQAGLHLAGYFLDRHVFAHHAPPARAPAARARLVARLARLKADS